MKTRIFTVVSVILMLVMGLCAQASAYSTPPSWLPMSMPSVTYDVATNKVTVETKPNVVLGTNVAASGSGGAPGIASFDPAQPWGVLNGTAFSRQLGWNDPNYAYADIPANDPTSIIYTIKSIYGPGAGIWIDCTGKSPELNSYLAVGMFGVNANDTYVVDVSNPTGYPYSGIFGTTYTDFVTKRTVVSPTRWQWDGMMDHNTNSVAFSALTGPSQLFFANYTVYIGDAAGNELRLDAAGGVHAAGEAGFDLLPSASATVTWQWKGPAFVFTSQTGVPTGAVVESEPIRISGITGSQAIAITGGEYAISTVASLTTAPATWGAWTTAPGTIATNYWVKVRQTAAATPGTLTVASLAIPAIPGPGEFRVTTAGVTNVPVPNVVGATEAAASSAITAATLTVGAVTTAHDAVIPAGTVISQNPVAESLVAPGTAVDLVVSSGPAMVAVPDVVNLTQVNAQSAIVAAALTVGTVSQEFSATVPSGSVIRQSPVAGTSVLPGSAVNLVVSTSDNVPDAFGFTPVTGGATAFATVSNAITVTGITGPAAISIAGGTSPGYSVSTDNGVTWSAFSTTTPATVSPNDQVKVRQTSAALPFTTTTTVLTVGGAKGSFSVTTGYLNPPSWMPMTMLSVAYDIPTAKLTVVDEATKLGAGVYPVLSYVPAGSYEPGKPWSVLDGGVALSRRLGWDDPTAAHGNGITPTGQLVVDIASAYGPNAGIWIERISQSPGLETYFADGMWGVGGTGNAASGTPLVYTDANGFPVIYDANYYGIFGTNGSSTKWKWDGSMIHNVYAVPAAYLTMPNQLFTATYRVYVGDATGAEIFNADGSSTSTVEVWSWQGPATVPDNVPDPFSFASQTVPASSVAVSEVVTVSGLAVPALISITGGEYAVSTDNGATWSVWSATLPATVANGSQVKVRLTAPATQGTTTSAILTVGGVSAGFTVTSTDTVPEAFSFTPVTGGATAFATVSNAITITGITGPAAIGIAGGTSPGYSVSTDNGVTWSAFSTTTPATVSPNDQIKVRQTSSALPFTTTTTVLTVGGVTGSFSVTTGYLNPPSWMPMTMLSVGYDTVTAKLTVVDEATKLGAGVYPTLGYVPAGSYEAGKPWSVLDGGVALSRRLGWDDPTAAHGNGITPTGQLVIDIAAAYGPNAGIWIERISQSPGLETYFADGMWGVGGTGNAASGTPLVYTDANGFPVIYDANYYGIFGTNGSSTKWKWDGSMIHNVYAVPAAYLTMPNQLFTATYRVYVGDATGAEILNADGSSTSTVEVWSWQGPATVPDNVPDPFSFASQTVPATSVAVSEGVTVSGLAVPSLISITGGEYAVSTDNGATWSVWSATLPATVANGNLVKVRLTAAATPSTTTSAVLTIGGVAGTFRVTTAALPTQQVTITTSPAGLSFIADGVTYTAPRTFTWDQGSSHSIAVASPQSGAGVRNSYISWSDGGAQSRTVTVPAAAITYTATFSTEYQLTTALSPAGAAVVTPATGNWYPAGALVTLTATPVTGYTFAGWTGGPVANATSARTTVTMNGPKTVTATLTGKPVLTANLQSKSGAAPLRTWTISLTNSGKGAAADARITGLKLTQTAGAACTPTVATAQFPRILGAIPVNGTAAGNVTINFNTCSAAARFSAAVTYSSDAGAITGTKVFANQFR